MQHKKGFADAIPRLDLRDLQAERSDLHNGLRNSQQEDTLIGESVGDAAAMEKKGGEAY